MSSTIPSLILPFSSQNQRSRNTRVLAQQSSRCVRRRVAEYNRADRKLETPSNPAIVQIHRRRGSERDSPRKTGDRARNILARERGERQAAREPLPQQ